MPAHNHPAASAVTDPGHVHALANGKAVVSDVGSGGGNGGSLTDLGDTSIASAPTGISVGTTTSNTGGGGAHNNIQPSSYFNVMIKL